jgi:hypothetical protein
VVLFEFNPKTVSDLGHLQISTLFTSLASRLVSAHSPYLYQALLRESCYHDAEHMERFSEGRVVVVINANFGLFFHCGGNVVTVAGRGVAVSLLFFLCV